MTSKKNIVSIAFFLFLLFFKNLSSASDCEKAKSLIKDGNEIIAQKPLEAEKLYREAVILCPESANAQYNLGLSLYALSSEKDAIEAFESALKLNPEHKEAEKALLKLRTKMPLNKPIAYEENYPRMVFIKGGCYEMGDNFGDGESDEKPVHIACVGNFYLGESEVTQAQWESLMGSNQSRHKGYNLPVDTVGWNDIQEFLRRLNEKTGKKYRLPTEAEWEYGAREGGKKIKYGTGKNEVDQSEANYDSVKGTVPVKSYSPNSLGLYDMAGNVWEMCADWYDENYYKNSSKDNPTGPPSGENKVLRGGSWSNKTLSIRVSNRYSYTSAGRLYTAGFRIAQ